MISRVFCMCTNSSCVQLFFVNAVSHSIKIYERCNFSIYKPKMLSLDKGIANYDFHVKSVEAVFFL